ncbi:MAG: hypothetical protein V3U34_00415 [candidate division NC10 bacterium]
MSTLANAYGNFLFPALQRVQGSVQTPYGTLLQPASRVAAYVRSGGQQDGDDTFVRNNLVQTLNQALARCRAGLGDVVYVLSDHAEDIDAADKMSNLVAGTKIIGVGSGALRPTFTWTAAAASWLFDVANVTLSNCILKLADAGNAGVTVIAPITISAAGCFIAGCDIFFGADANDDVTIGINTTAAADDCGLIGCDCFGVTAAECTTFLRLVGADRFRLEGCTIQGATGSTTVGVIQFLTTASLQVLIANSVFINYKALSVHAATGMAAATGIVSNCGFGILDTATLGGFETEGSLQFFNCTTANLAGENSGAKTPQSTTT